jgi:hypothetical protein
MRLHAMLEDAEKMGFQDVVAWQDGANSFKVMQSGPFSNTIMKNYFNQTKYKSFQRQLNMYGFRRIHSGVKRGGYAHQYFKRGTPELCNLIMRHSNRHWCSKTITCQETKVNS